MVRFTKLVLAVVGPYLPSSGGSGCPVLWSCGSHSSWWLHGEEIYDQEAIKEWVREAAGLTLPYPS